MSLSLLCLTLLTLTATSVLRISKSTQIVPTNLIPILPPNKPHNHKQYLHTSSSAYSHIRKHGTRTLRHFWCLEAIWTSAPATFTLSWRIPAQLRWVSAPTNSRDTANSVFDPTSEHEPTRHNQAWTNARSERA